MDTRRLLTVWWFTLALLLGQATAFAHALSHLDAHGHEPGLPDTPCAVCVAQAQLGGVLPSPPLALATQAADAMPHAPKAPPAPEPARLAACARAPPVHSA